MHLMLRVIHLSRTQVSDKRACSCCNCCNSRSLLLCHSSHPQHTHSTHVVACHATVLPAASAACERLRGYIHLLLFCRYAASVTFIGHCCLGRLCIKMPATLQLSMPHTVVSARHRGTPLGSGHLVKLPGQGL